MSSCCSHSSSQCHVHWFCGLISFYLGSVALCHFWWKFFKYFEKYFHLFAALCKLCGTNNCRCCGALNMARPVNIFTRHDIIWDVVLNMFRIGGLQVCDGSQGSEPKRSLHGRLHRVAVQIPDNRGAQEWWQWGDCNSTRDELHVSYVTPCATCWSDAGWLGRQQWIYRHGCRSREQTWPELADKGRDAVC